MTYYFNYCPEKYFTPNEVNNMISKYSSKKSSGFDLITTKVIIFLLKKVIILVTYIYNVTVQLIFSNTMEILTNNYVCQVGQSTTYSNFV